MITMTFTFFDVLDRFSAWFSFRSFLLSRCSLSGLLCVDLNDGLICFILSPSRERERGGGGREGLVLKEGWIIR